MANNLYLSKAGFNFTVEQLPVSPTNLLFLGDYSLSNAEPYTQHQSLRTEYREFYFMLDDGDVIGPTVVFGAFGR